MNLLDLVGNTPLCDISHLVGINGNGGNGIDGIRLLAKCEGNNPGGSVKDRAARCMILNAIERGELKPGMRLIEATSGNTGIALAMIARSVDIEMHLVMPDSSTIERTQTMEAYGATVHLVNGGIEAARDYADQQVTYTAGNANAFLMLNQFANPDNPAAHYASTGPEIWRDTQHEVTHFVSAMGTTGTIMGVSRYLKEQNSDITIIGCQPTEGSKIPGIRRWPTEYLPKIYDPSRVDRIIDITQNDAEATARLMAREAGLFIGISSGGAAWAALQVAKEIATEAATAGTTATIVFIVCDRGDRYLSSKVFAQ